MIAYSGLAKALTHGPAWVLAEIDRAGLRGRGGSGRGGMVAPKWRKAARARNTVRYVIANGAESSPVSQKDRWLMARSPHRVLEGLLIAMVAIGASEGFIYIRGDAEEATAAMAQAVAEARAASLFGPGTALPVAVEIQPSLPGYISGEETAVIDALEGLEGLPQPKPPTPEESGLRGNPTSVNNVETLAAAASVLRDGVEAFRSVGTPDCPGTALFTVTGDVARPGVYEVAYGLPLAALLEMAGAPARDEILAVLPGGLSSGPLRPDELEVPLTYEDLAAIGSTLGPAAVVVFGRGGADFAAMVAETAAFLSEASCGQCQGCKEGHKRLVDAVAAGQAEEVRNAGQFLHYGRGNCAHPTGTARLVLRAVEAFPEAWK